MEDRCIVIPDLSRHSTDPTMEPIAIMGVFDGHNGQACADYLKTSFHTELKTFESFLTHTDGWEAKYDQHALMECLSLLDETFLANAVAYNPPEFSGACVCVAIIRPGVVSMAWLGDCRAILCQADFTAKQLTLDHRPTRDDERARIEATGEWG